MEFFLDTANLDEIRKAQAQGLMDGVTTNPTLLSREGGDWRRQAQTICNEVDGPVSLEVVGTTAEEMVREAEDLATFGDNVVIKVPITSEGLIATKALYKKGVKTNVTLVFSPLQALLAAKAGATYVSPFVGRLDGISIDGMELISQIRTIFDNYEFPAKILVASIRNPLHVLDSALIGADVATIPFSVISDLAKHPLTDKGLEQFNADWEKLTK
ncbi:fructose-6-phosphate aldolase [Maridesulfovibrio hydrothermalis]|uniref:Probable transaldolase n=1 Tax=Maridesulfovibrio hydrothermalis AM13 = DSM 14728 TaxID=1121451 RepID=L0RBU2_9BACT|nr:fructose-6-phosphate aldolase [Maridesulfovibrio hydrothermalis]CCO23692.1 putative transaldolase [Maridesulfovibrio hydrothermalis AM13 = DSM 14728]